MKLNSNWNIAPRLMGYAVAAAIAFTLNTQAVTLSLSPSSQTVAQGNSVDVFLEISGLGHQTQPSLGAFDLLLSFDPAVLTFNSAAFGDMLGPINGSVADAFPVPPDGTVNLYGISLDTASDLNQYQSGSFAIATLSFTATGAGISSLELSSILLGDADGAPMIADNVSGGRITVTGLNPVPDGEMAGFGITTLALAFASLALANRKRESRA